MSSNDRRGWAVVTGASSGLGALFAERLAQQGKPLILAGRNRTRLEQVRQHIRQLAPVVEVELVVGDLSTNSGVVELIAALGERDIDILVNNAGFGTYGPVSETAAARDRDLVAVNIDAQVGLTHAVLPAVRARGCRILNVASTIVFQPAPYQATYAASKAFVLAFSQAMSAETKGSGVTVTALCPGSTRTGFVDALDADVSTVAIYKNLGSPERVVDAGLRALDRGKPVVIPGLRNRMLAQTSRMAPGWMIMRLSERLLRSAEPAAR